MKPLVLFDVNYLAYRAFYTTGRLSHQESPTGVLFGVIKSVQYAKTLYPGHKFVFCFDHGKGKRETLYPGYKNSRRSKITEDQAVQLEDLKSQLTALKTKYLYRLGYNNVFMQDGYEADDVIAKVLKQDPTREAVVYSDDKDLYQLLSENVSMYKPKSGVVYTAKQFVKDFGVQPEKWAKVKAIAGCTSDDVVGVPGVGEGYAAKYAAGTLPKDSQKYKMIKAYRDVWIKNLQIVRLPLAGVKDFKLQKDEVTADKWDEVASTLGMSSVLGGMPKAIDKPKPLLRNYNA